MNLAVDLHSHSGYAGGVGQVLLTKVSEVMKQKGIDVFGTGDCLLPARSAELQKELISDGKGLFHLPNDSSKFLLQTEVIISAQLDGFRNRTVAHHIILFPDFEAIKRMQKLMQDWQMKNTIGRPFIVCQDQSVVEERLMQIAEIDPLIEIIPAHVLTPDGILGSKNNLQSIRQFYGDFTSQIRIIETGLSADPTTLQKIPDFANLTFISNSDCHSAALNRIGREFTILDTSDVSYQDIILAMRENRVDLTAEFNPAEGRYFLTGHRANRHKNGQEIIYAEELPPEMICEICGKEIKLGVKHRAIQLSDETIVPLKRNFLNMIPLIEVIAFSQNIKNANSKTVAKIFAKILQRFPSEISLWRSDSQEIISQLKDEIAGNVLESILAVKTGKFKFEPAGFDGNYGVLKIG